MRALALLLILSILVAGCYGIESRKRAAQLEFEKGMRLYDRCEFKAAQKAFEHSLWLNPDHEGSRRYLGVVRRMQGDTEPYPWDVEELDKIYGKSKKYP